MKIEVFDVGHGGCALVTFPNGVRMMLDCGFHGLRPWYPSVQFAGQCIDLLVALNLDEDHLDDLPYLLRNVRLGAIRTNPTVTPSALRAMKPKGMRPGVDAMYRMLPYFSPFHRSRRPHAHRWHAWYTAGLLGPAPESLGSASAWYHCNSYPYFDNTNDLSMAVFVRQGAFTALFAGDLEAPGWKNLLANPAFARELRTVNVLVASHHGRRSGCCPELFQYWHPNCVIISDADIQHRTQETTQWYAGRTTGIPDYSKPAGLFGLQPKRHVFTTRSDGSVTINIEQSGAYVVTWDRTSVLPRRSISAAPNEISPSALFAPPSGPRGLAQSDEYLDRLLAALR